MAQCESVSVFPRPRRCMDMFKGSCQNITAMWAEEAAVSHRPEVKLDVSHP